MCRYYLIEDRVREWEMESGLETFALCVVALNMGSASCWQVARYILPKELPSQCCIFFKRPPVLSLNLPFLSQSFDVKGRKISKMMKWQKTKTPVRRLWGISQNVIALLSPALPILFIHQGCPSRGDVLIFARIAIDLVGRLIQLVPAEGNIVLNGGCRSVSEKTYITTVPMDSCNLGVMTYWPKSITFWVSWCWQSGNKISQDANMLCSGFSWHF